jgi:hypothetical protein
MHSYCEYSSDQGELLERSHRFTLTTSETSAMGFALFGTSARSFVAIVCWILIHSQFAKKSKLTLDWCGVAISFSKR